MYRSYYKQRHNGQCILRHGGTVTCRSNEYSYLKLIGDWSDPFVYTPTSITNNIYCTICKHDNVAYTYTLLLNYTCYPDSNYTFLYVRAVVALVSSPLLPSDTPLLSTPAATGE